MYQMRTALPARASRSKSTAVRSTRRSRELDDDSAQQDDELARNVAECEDEINRIRARHAAEKADMQAQASLSCTVACTYGCISVLIFLMLLLQIVSLKDSLRQQAQESEASLVRACCVWRACCGDVVS